MARETFERTKPSFPYTYVDSGPKNTVFFEEIKTSSKKKVVLGRL